ncbi:hypothetical protein WJX77_004887 [Trebouxia sp. C0004]
MADVKSLPLENVKEEQASATNGSYFSPGADHVAVVKGNGSSISPQQGSGNNGGSGQGGGGSGGGHPGNDSAGDGPDNQTKFLLLLLSIALGAASGFGIYHLLKAIHGVTSRRRSAQPAVGTQQRPHDDIAALKRLLREVFTKQMQMERRISVVEPHDNDQPSFDPLERSRNGWASLSAPGKSKVELSGSLVMGSALLYSKDQDEQRAASSLDHTGVSKSTLMTLNVKTDLGGPESGGLHAQFVLDADKSQAHLQKVVYECQPREDMSLYLAPIGGQAADAVMTLNAQAGQGVSCQVQHGCPLHQQCKGSGAVVNYTHQDKTLSAAHFRQGDGEAHSLLQLSANPMSSFCCALVTTQSAFASHQNRILASGDGVGRSRSSSSEVEESSAVDYPAQQGASGQQPGNGAAPYADTASTSTSSAGWPFRGLKGPCFRHSHTNSDPRNSQRQPVAAEASGQSCLGVTGLWNWCEEIAVSGWAAVGQGGSRAPSWGVTLSSYPDGAGDAWAFSLRRSSDSFLTSQPDSVKTLTAELSMQKAIADGVMLTPGLVFACEPGGSLAALCCRTEWHC